MLYNNRAWTVTKFLFAALLAIGIILVTLNGLIWNYGIVAVKPIQLILASLLPPVTWLSFLSLSQNLAKTNKSTLILHLIPTILVITLLFVSQTPIDAVLFLQYFGYGILLFRLSRAGPDALEETRLQKSLVANYVIKISAFILVGSALLDVAVILDFIVAEGIHVRTFLSTASVLMLLVLGTAAMTGQSALNTETEPDESPPNKECPTELSELEIQDVLAAVKMVFEEQRLYALPDLTLLKIARKVGIPTRRISQAINRYHGMNVSQYVNEYRIKEICSLLESTDRSITDIHIESGFLTKSNFNREFRRSIGCSPSEWRNRAKAAKQETLQS